MIEPQRRRGRKGFREVLSIPFTAFLLAFEDGEVALKLTVVSAEQ